MNDKYINPLAGQIDDDVDDNIIEMLDETGRKHYFYEEMQFFADGNRYALLRFIKTDDEFEIDDDENITIAKIVVNPAGEDEYFSPSDEEFDIAVKAYEEIAVEDE
ncbi:DUF1292 domain-containing protein [Pectinatus frisingensis]|uniref:DUF1292 domain-containing protein n=1 Tax=Pectinatus frisingensis TaxID=865 RepID=UPI0018C5F890|nr:DUF1292 domain-containing protein [Pectinatus frisingensis]